MSNGSAAEKTARTLIAGGKCIIMIPPAQSGTRTIYGDEFMSKRSEKRARRWFRLDNAALIFPAIMRRHWSNCFRLSVTLHEDVDPAVLERAAAELAPRFPTVFVRLRTGFFWYFLEQVKKLVNSIHHR